MSTGAWTLEKLQALPRREIQALARENGVKANAKTVDLVAKLAERLITRATSCSPPTLHDEDLMEVDDELPSATNVQHPLNETFTIDDKSIADSTHVADEENTPHSLPANEDLYLTDDEEPIVAGNLDVTRTLPESNKENSTYVVESPAPATVAENTTTAAAPCASSRHSRSLTPRQGGIATRFTEKHKLTYNRQESIQDAQARLVERHRKTMGSVPKRVNELATPKNACEPVRRRFKTPTTPHDEHFKFGGVPAECIETVQKPIPPFSERLPRPPPRQLRPAKTDVKALTSRPSIPVGASRTPDPSRIEQLATPKSAGPVPVDRTRKSYTPKKAPFRYVDTTKMSDAEFKAYQRQQRQEEIRRSKALL